MFQQGKAVDRIVYIAHCAESHWDSVPEPGHTALTKSSIVVLSCWLSTRSGACRLLSFGEIAIVVFCNRSRLSSYSTQLRAIVALLSRGRPPSESATTDQRADRLTDNEPHCQWVTGVRKAPLITVAFVYSLPDDSAQAANACSLSLLESVTGPSTGQPSVSDTMYRVISLCLQWQRCYVSVWNQSQVNNSIAFRYSLRECHHDTVMSSHSANHRTLACHTLFTIVFSQSWLKRNLLML